MAPSGTVHLVCFVLLCWGINALDAEPAHQQMKAGGLQPTGGPLPVTTFPYTLCQRNGSSPYVLEHTNTVQNDDGTTRHCFKLSLNSAFVPAPAAVDGTAMVDTCKQAFDLRAIEFDIWGKCRRFVRAVMFNQNMLHATFMCFSQRRGCVFKITRGLGQMLISNSELQGKSVTMCFTLVGPCAESLSTFCKGEKCNTAFFDMQRQCCPA